MGIITMKMNNLGYLIKEGIRGIFSYHILPYSVTAVMLVLAFKKVHPIVIICLSAVLGIVIGYLGA